MKAGSWSVTLASAIAATILIGPASVAVPISADACGGSGGFGGAYAHCVKSGSETSIYIAAHSDHTYTIRPACKIGGQAVCTGQEICRIDGHDGLLFEVLEDGVLLRWEACLTDQEAQHLGTITPGAVQHAFERLAWPDSPLVIQPPKGRTLVNFDTNFYTTNTAPTTQTVQLLGQDITIEATPVDYVWHFDSGTDDGDLTTSDAGAAYPDLRVTYRYLRVGDVRPSLDTVYAGRYRVAGGGWQTIPNTLTVAGAPQDLVVVSATPHLVGY